MWERLPLDRLQRIFGEGSTREAVSRLEDEVRSKKIREYSYKVSGIANKRIRRLEETGLESPAYRHWSESRGGRMFGIRGLDDDGVVQEIQEGERFINMGTSSVRGATKYVKEIGERLGLDGDRVEIQDMSGTVFEVSSRIEQYLRTAGEGHAIGSDILQQYVTEFAQRDSTPQDPEMLLGTLLERDIYGDLQSEIQGEIFGVVEDELGGFGDFLS